MSVLRRNLSVSGAYGGLLERLLPRLEGTLLRRLEQLEDRVARHEAGHGFSNAKPATPFCKTRRPAAAELSAGQASVIVLGARLRSDQRYCRALIERVAAVLRARWARR
jgi:hypothetical protein